MNILHIIASVDPKDGGPIEGLNQQAKHRRTRNIPTDVISLDAPGDVTLDNPPFTYYPLGHDKISPQSRARSWNPLWRYRYAPAMVPWLKKNARHYDVIIVNGLWNYTAMAARIALVGGKVPYVVFTHGMLDPWFRKAYPLKGIIKQLFWWFCEGPLLNNASAVFYTTEEEKTLAETSFKPYRANGVVVGYGTSDVPASSTEQINTFRALLPNLGERPYLLFISRIHPKKGCDLLIEAFAKIAPKAPNLDLVIAGPDQTGWMNDLTQQAKALGVSERIHWPGMLKGDLKWGAFHGAEAFVLPSHQENFGIVVAEAMAAKKPVLITDKVNIWKEVLSAKAGHVETDTIEGITGLLEHYLAMTEHEKTAAGNNGRKAFLEKFEINVALDSINKALETVISNDRTP